MAEREPSLESGAAARQRPRPPTIPRLSTPRPRGSRLPRHLTSWGFRPLALLLLAAVLAALSGCALVPGVDDATVNARFARVDSLRSHGRYEAALGVADTLVRLADRRSLRAWQAQDARRLRADLTRILRLPAEGRAAIACADSLTAVIERHQLVEEDYVACMTDATRQLELRHRWLGPTHLDVAASLELLGQIANRFGENGLCAEYIGRALALRRAALGSRHPLVAESLEQWGIQMKTRLKLVRADAAEREALDILESAYPPDDPHLASMLESLGSLCRLRLHSTAPNAAVDYYRRALAIRRRHDGPRSVAVAGNLTWQAYALMFAKRNVEADAMLREAEGILHERGLDLSHDMGNVMLNRGMLAWDRGDYVATNDLWQHYFECHTFVSARLPLGFGLNRLFGPKGEWLDALLHLGRTDEAFAMLCRDAGSVTHSLLNLSAARDRWRADAARLDSLRLEARRLRDAVDATAPDPDTIAFDRAVQVSAPDTALDALRLRLATTDAERLRLEQSLVVRMDRTPEGAPVSPAAVQARLAPDQAMVGWVFACWRFGNPMKMTLWGYVVRRTGPVRWFPLATWRWRSPLELARWWSSFGRPDKIMRGADRWPHHVPADPELSAELAKAYARYFRPLLPGLKGVQELIVVDVHTTDGGTPSMQPEYLVDEHGRWLSEHFAVSHVASPDVFVRLSRDRPAPGGRNRSLVAVADPRGPEPGTPEDLALAAAAPGDDAGSAGSASIAPSLFRGALDGDPDALRRLPVLPEARREAREVAALFPQARVLIGPQATASALGAALGGHGHVSVLHLATHALIDSDLPERSLLVLSPGPRGDGDAANAEEPARRVVAGTLTDDDIMLGRRIDVDLVTLSGCRTSQGAGSRSGEELGFAQAFFASGARCLLMSRWNVDDRATALLMGRFYENLTGRRPGARAGAPRAPMSPARALQEAQSWLREWRSPDGGTPFAHPIYWAGFELIGAAG